MDRAAGDARKTIEPEPEPESELATADEGVEPSPAELLLTGPARRKSDAAPLAIPGVVRGTIVGEATDGRPLVTWPEGPSGPSEATAVWISDQPAWSECVGLAAVIGFEDGDPARPLLLGLLGAPPRTRRIEAGDELTLQCGEAKIVLRADGSVTILGTKVVTRARGVNKIKGGSVQIN